MITINLTPEEELENPFWFVADVGVLLVSAVVVFFLVSFHFKQIESEISLAEADVERSQNGYRLLSDDLARQQNLENSIAELNGRLQALSRITSSRLVRYRPVIILEHLQNLRPDGVWFDQVSLLREGPRDQQIPQATLDADEEEGLDGEAEGDEGQGETQRQIQTQLPVDQNFNEILIRGKALDNVLVAEFIAALKATQTQDVHASDLRTQVFFSELLLHNTRITDFDLVGGGGGGGDDAVDNSRVVGFEIQFVFREHSVRGGNRGHRVNISSLFDDNSNRQTRF